jgi:hypothetical protein
MRDALFAVIPSSPPETETASGLDQAVIVITLMMVAYMIIAAVDIWNNRRRP